LSLLTTSFFPYTTLFRSYISSPFLPCISFFLLVDDLPAICLQLSQIAISFVFCFIAFFYLAVVEHGFILWPPLLQNEPKHDNNRSEEHTSELQSRFDIVC